MNQPRDENPTNCDVARLSGLGIATVSRVLNSPEQATLETREEFLRVIEDLGYVPKTEARPRHPEHVQDQRISLEWR